MMTAKHELCHSLAMVSSPFFIFPLSVPIYLLQKGTVDPLSLEMIQLEDNSTSARKDRGLMLSAFGGGGLRGLLRFPPITLQFNHIYSSD